MLDNRRLDAYNRTNDLQHPVLGIIPGELVKPQPLLASRNHSWLAAIYPFDITPELNTPLKPASPTTEPPSPNVSEADLLPTTHCRQSFSHRETVVRQALGPTGLAPPPPPLGRCDRRQATLGVPFQEGSTARPA
ncbi:hypothetical protein Cob_v004435 [Colletotrichum orbiculare MAFF 240422]|uniref:Uncharacterized protein n=1 Tax=Colletotrichum orbiculare (strain 104-T / ATCC 96160 / CBS 514.97 / LARS 414 / MAFF 240422) TaxID=1213857 RepID=A0A484FZ70_COLOR|nr:hypothetical protein Cob_v004435 [Colletotrichum orbiculare MAFF 240422]